MCGIFGYIGQDDNLSVCIEGLKQLEYRGYDSAGFAGIYNQELIFRKEKGSIENFEKKVSYLKLHLLGVIGHTRWATHGRATEENAHPHFDMHHHFALIHNGIIENHLALKKQLRDENIQFYSDTDTEVLVKLLAYYFEGNILKALRKTMKRIKGSFAIAMIHKDFPNQIFAACRHSPLVIGKGSSEMYLSSDPHAFLGKNLDIIYLKDGCMCHLHPEKVHIYDENLTVVSHKMEKFQVSIPAASKEGFSHFMLKEIYEQPKTIKRTLMGRYLLEYGTADFSDLNISKQALIGIKHILIIACGSSLHAALIGANYLEDIARVPTHAEIASELRYKNPIISEETLVIAISQSGETADTIAALREAKVKGAKIMGICNRNPSTLSRECNCLDLNAGPEISVCSTKAFTSQVALLFLFAIYMARLRHLSKDEGKYLLLEMETVPGKIEEILQSTQKIEDLAKKYAKYQNFLFIGRRYMYPTALEAALKLKEISYINANGYPAGELKHGPIALIHSHFPVIGLCANRQTKEKILSNLMEARARKAPIVIFASQNFEVQHVTEDVIFLPESIDELAPILTSVGCQLFAYYIAKELGAEIDKPRNLAKSVTVE